MRALRLLAMSLIAVMCIAAVASGQEEVAADVAEETVEIPNPRVGGRLTYGEFKVPMSLDPVTANDPVKHRVFFALSELFFDFFWGFKDLSNCLCTGSPSSGILLKQLEN